MGHPGIVLEHGLEFRVVLYQVSEVRLGALFIVAKPDGDGGA
jgi:hypothetical protein